MSQVKVLHPLHCLVSIPVDKAIYCENCKNITNSPSERCGKCGSKLVLRLATLIHRPPSGPDSGPASPGSSIPALYLEVARAA
jgi:hypothetical protein